MKKTLFLLLFVLTALLNPAVAQKTLAIIDKAQFMNEETERITGERLAGESVTLATIIDTRKGCDYLYATLFRDGQDLLVSLTDCKDRTAGQKNLGSKILTASDSEKSLLLYFALSELLKMPFSDEPAVADKPAPEAPPAPAAPQVIDPGHHKSRYFFAPSAYNLEKGEIYYNSLYFLVHDVQYGITDQFSLGMGTTVFGLPFYLTPKITIPVSENSAFAVGDLLMLGTWGARFSANLLYTTFTTGGNYNNITFGGGYFFAGGRDISDNPNAIVLNLSSLIRLSDHIYFITENYGSGFKSTPTASSYDSNTGIELRREFNQNVFFIYGLAGFRFINRTRDIKSWQFGLSYVFNSRSEVPDMYKYSNWYVENHGGSNFFAFPVVGFARKFSSRY